MSLKTSVSKTRIHIDEICTLKAIKSDFKGHMINIILHSWSFHVKSMKHAHGSFDKFHLK